MQLCRVLVSWTILQYSTGKGPLLSSHSLSRFVCTTATARLQPSWARPRPGCVSHRASAFGPSPCHETRLHTVFSLRGQTSYGVDCTRDTITAMTRPGDRRRPPVSQLSAPSASDAASLQLKRLRHTAQYQPGSTEQYGLHVRTTQYRLCRCKYVYCTCTP